MGGGQRLLLCSGFCRRQRKLLLVLGTPTGHLNRDRGRGGLDTSIELRQRRTTAGADGAQRLEVLEVGLGPPAPVAAWDSRALAAADGDKGKRGWWGKEEEEEEGGKEETEEGPEDEE